MWGSGTGAAVMRRIAAPMVGGMVSATVLTLVIIPSLYLLLNGWKLQDEQGWPGSLHKVSESA
jgi:Cu(I)/Ag(I) efflux system membrane protein CusA/SilA